MKLPDMGSPIFESDDMCFGFGPNSDGEMCVYVAMKADAGLEMMGMLNSLIPGFDNTLGEIQGAFGLNELMGGENNG